MSTLSSKVCIVQVLVGLESLYALWNSEVSAFGSFFEVLYLIGTASSGLVSEVATTLGGVC